MLTVKSSAMTLLALVGASVGAYSLWEKNGSSVLVEEPRELLEEEHQHRRLYTDPGCADFGHCCYEPGRRQLRKQFLTAMEQQPRALALGNGECETAYALWNPNDSQDNCFIHEGFDKPERWGWRLELDGTQTNMQTFQVWAAAGQCNLGAGELVGEITIKYNAGNKKCRGVFKANSDHAINTFHFYCGADPYPKLPNGKDTVANGQFPCTNENLGGATESACVLSGVMPNTGSDIVHAIAHFDVCGTGDTPPPPPPDYCEAKENCETPAEFCIGKGLTLCGDSCCNGMITMYQVEAQCEADSGQFCAKLCDDDGGVFGDPHFRTWHHMHEFEYHGECDLVFLKAPALDMDIHVRTTVRYDYSFVSQAAVRIGEEIFEVASWGEYQLNGMSSIDLPAFIGGYPITRTQMAHKDNLKVKFVIHLDQDQDIRISSYKDYVAVRIDNGTLAMYEGASGMMGDYETGSMYMRDGTIQEDPNLYAPEWQVRPEVDGVLFAGERAPVYPQQCVMPTVDAISARDRKLGEASVTRSQAEAACAHRSEQDKASCIEDVLKTQDLDIANADF